MSDLIHKQLDRTLQISSLSDLVRAKQSTNVHLLIDVSSSMNEKMRNGKSKIEGLREVVTDIQKQRKTQMIAFGGEGVFTTTSVPTPNGGTPLMEAIDFARAQNVGRLVAVSDGIPNDPVGALEAAKRFGGQIDVVYVGDPGDGGEEFLKRLARETGGTEFHGDLSEPKQLSKGVIGLLNGDVDDDDE